MGTDALILDLHDTPTNSHCPEPRDKPKPLLCNAYKLLNLELSFFVESYKHRNAQVPDHRTMQLEACRIIFAPKVLLSSKDNIQSINTDNSWLRDLISDNNALAVQAQCLPLQTPAGGQLHSLGIAGERPMFTDCPLETELHQFVLAERKTNTAAISDIELQEEACKIMARTHQALGFPLTDFTFNWLTTLARSSTSWLVHFRQRTNLPLLEPDCVHSPSFMLEFAATPQTPMILASDAEYPCANISMMVQDLESYNKSNCGFASHPPFIAGTGETCDSALAPSPSIIDIMPSSQPTTPYIFQDQCPPGENRRGTNAIMDPLQLPTGQTSSAGLPSKATAASEQSNVAMYQMHDPNFNECQGRQLSHWVTASISPDNPSCYIPSDQEIQYHARYLMYDE